MAAHYVQDVTANGLALSEVGCSTAPLPEVCCSTAPLPEVCCSTAQLPEVCCSTAYHLQPWPRLHCAWLRPGPLQGMRCRKVSAMAAIALTGSGLTASGPALSKVCSTVARILPQ